MIFRPYKHVLPVAITAEDGKQNKNEHSYRVKLKDLFIEGLDLVIFSDGIILLGHERIILLFRILSHENHHLLLLTLIFIQFIDIRFYLPHFRLQLYDRLLIQAEVRS